MNDERRCEFTLSECSGGVIFQDGSVGCGFWDSDEQRCSMLEETNGQNPRDFYNEMLTLIP
jgi:hypothetical protein